MLQAEPSLRKLRVTGVPHRSTEPWNAMRRYASRCSSGAGSPVRRTVATRESDRSRHGRGRSRASPKAREPTRTAIAARARGVRRGPWPQTSALDRARFLQQDRRRARCERRGVRPRSKRSTAASRCAKRNTTSPTRRIASATTRVSRRNRTARPSTFPRPRRASPCANRSACAARSCPGIIRC
jgi:hypothetical protein